MTRHEGTAENERRGKRMSEEQSHNTQNQVHHRRVSRRLRRRRRLVALVRGLGLLCLGLTVVLILSIRNQLASGESQTIMASGTAQMAASGQYGADTTGENETEDEGGNESEKNEESTTYIQGLPEEVYLTHPDWEEDFLTPNEYSRPGDPLTEVTNIFVHYTANPGTSAAQNRSYFEQQKDTHEVSVSSHFIIGYDGEILQVIPLDEIAYAVKTRNMDSISIECCYKSADGAFTEETYDSLITLLAWLIDVYDLESTDILRHYDCGGKKCPLYYVEHEDAWKRLIEDVEAYTFE